MGKYALPSKEFDIDFCPMAFFASKKDKNGRKTFLHAMKYFETLWIKRTLQTYAP